MIDDSIMNILGSQDRKGGFTPPSYCHFVPVPDPFRGKHSDAPDPSAAYVEELKRTLSHLETQDRVLAGFISEPILSCAGQIVPPQGFLSQAYDLVRATGGVCIADEVQVYILIYIYSICVYERL